MNLIKFLITLLIACAVSLTSQAVEEKSANTTEQSAQEAVAQPASETKQSVEVATKTSAETTININTASAKELENLPGIGPKTARRILAYRQEHGTFASVEQLREVPGIGDKKLGDVKDMISVE